MADPIDPYTDLLASVGRALNNWSQVESGIEDIFRVLSGTDESRSHIIMGSIISFETRLQICHNLITNTELRSELRLFWNRAFNRISKQYSKRAEVAHFTIMNYHRNRSLGPRLFPFFSVGLMTLNAVQPQTRKYRVKTLSAAEINSRAERFDDLADALRWFWHELEVLQGKHEANLVPASDLVRLLLTPCDQTSEGSSPPPQS